MMKKAGESEDEFVMNEADDMNDDGDKDSDSGNVKFIFRRIIDIYCIQINRSAIK